MDKNDEYVPSKLGRGNGGVSGSWAQESNASNNQYARGQNSRGRRASPDVVYVHQKSPERQRETRYDRYGAVIREGRSQDYKYNQYSESTTGGSRGDHGVDALEDEIAKFERELKELKAMKEKKARMNTSSYTRDNTQHMNYSSYNRDSASSYARDMNTSSYNRDMNPLYSRESARDMNSTSNYTRDSARDKNPLYTRDAPATFGKSFDDR